MENCKNKNFTAAVNVARLTKDDNTEDVVGYTAYVQIKCSDCGLPFEFIGVPGGYSPLEPMVNVDATELRTPIRPSTDPVEQVNALLK